MIARGQFPRDVDDGADLALRRGVHVILGRRQVREVAAFRRAGENLFQAADAGELFAAEERAGDVAEPPGHVHVGVLVGADHRIEIELRREGQETAHRRGGRGGLFLDELRSLLAHETIVQARVGVDLDRAVVGFADRLEADHVALDLLAENRTRHIGRLVAHQNPRQPGDRRQVEGGDFPAAQLLAEAGAGDVGRRARIGGVPLVFALADQLLNLLFANHRHGSNLRLLSRRSTGRRLFEATDSESAAGCSVNRWGSVGRGSCWPGCNPPARPATLCQ